MNNFYVPENIYVFSQYWFTLKVFVDLTNICAPKIEYLSGMYLGTVIAMPLAGILAEHINWESIFYVFGASIFSENFSHWRFLQGFTKTSAICSQILSNPCWSNDDHDQDFWLCSGAGFGGGLWRTRPTRTGASLTLSSSTSRWPHVHHLKIWNASSLLAVSPSLSWSEHGGCDGQRSNLQTSVARYDDQQAGAIIIIVIMIIILIIIIMMIKIILEMMMRMTDNNK